MMGQPLAVRSPSSSYLCRSEQISNAVPKMSDKASSSLCAGHGSLYISSVLRVT
jgi:hypothetical protein